MIREEYNTIVYRASKTSRDVIYCSTMEAL
jgi:hypothetical protein